MGIKQNTLTTNTQQELVKAGCLTYVASGDTLTLGAYVSGNKNYMLSGTSLGPDTSSCAIQIPGTWSKISTGKSTVGGIKSGNTLWVWGDNGGGAIGNNTTVASSSPVQIPGTTWCCIKSGTYTATAMKTDGTLWNWGENNFGTIGNGDIINKSSPTQVPGTTWCKFGQIANNVYAIKTDNTLWSWGYNGQATYGYYALGTGSSDKGASSPVQITGTCWCHVDGAFNAGNLAIKTDNTLWAWGFTSTGEGNLGLNNNTCYGTPQQIPGTTWCFSNGAGRVGFAIKTDNSLWSWGYNTHGLVGNNSVIPRSSPIQIPGSWLCVRGRSYSATGIKTDGSRWVWGRGSHGVLGQGNVINYSSPVQLGTASWCSIDVDYDSQVGIKYS